MFPLIRWAPNIASLSGTVVLGAVVSAGTQYVEVVHSGSNNQVVVGDQYAEVVHSGSNNQVLVGDQYAEVAHSGSNNLIKIGAQYAEVIVPYP